MITAADLFPCDTGCVGDLPLHARIALRVANEPITADEIRERIKRGEMNACEDPNDCIEEKQRVT